MRKSITFNTLILIMCLAHAPYTASMFRHGGPEDSTLQSHTSPYNPDTQSDDSRSLHRAESHAGAMDMNANAPHEEPLDVGAAPDGPMAQPNLNEQVNLEVQPLPQNYAYLLYPSDDDYDYDDDDYDDDDAAEYEQGYDRYNAQHWNHNVNHTPTYDPNARFELLRQLYQSSEREYSDDRSRHLLFAIREALQEYHKRDDKGLNASTTWDHRVIELSLRDAITMTICNSPYSRDDNDGHMDLTQELKLASTRNQIEKVKNRLAVSTNPNFTCHGENNRLHIALLHREHNIAQQLMGTDIDVEARDTLERTPLHVAAYLANYEVAKQLIATGANVGAEDCIRQTPLHHACQRGNISVVQTPDHRVAQLLVDNRATIDAPDIQRRTPLHIAANNDHRNAIRLLRAAGAEINSRDSQQKTPLHYAADKGNWCTVKMLIDLGADPNVADEYQKTPLHYAVSGPVSYRTITDHYKTVKLLLKANADPNARDNRQHTPLFCVALKGDTEIVKLLLDANATVNITDTNGQNPMHFVVNGYFREHPASKRYNSTAQLLIDAGTDPVTRDHKQKTPLDLTVTLNFPILDTLLKYDPDMEVSGIPRNTPPARQGKTTLQLTAGLKIRDWQKARNTHVVHRCVELGAKMENARPWQWSLL